MLGLNETFDQLAMTNLFCHKVSFGSHILRNGASIYFCESFHLQLFRILLDLSRWFCFTSMDGKFMKARKIHGESYVWNTAQR